ncbi:portal protein [Desulfovibrio aminophilus]|uniref:portal protein n=1 Tax=Desulfovibrio aminophilus TaxID=81425 RepID=UPI0004112B66|nr:portal protein [Desulfovibrio aminophilus]
MDEARIDALLARRKSLEEARDPWLPTWEELSDYVLPRKNSFRGRTSSRGRAGDEKIYDSTPCHALDLLGAALGGLLTNPCLPWFRVRARDKRLADQEGVRTYVSEATERMAALFNSEASGFQAAAHELYLDVVLLGTGVLYVEADAECAVRFSARPLSEVCVAEDVRGVVDTVLRTYELTARQAASQWGEACSEETRRKAGERPEEPVEILHAVFPRADRDPLGLGNRNFPFASVYVELGARRVLEESGYLEMPYMVPRWSKAAGEVYGRGPGLTALSDIRVLNAMSRTALMAAEKMSDPPLMVPDDGFLGPIRSGPGGLSYYRAGSGDRIEALPVAVDLKATESMMAARRDSIRAIFLNDQLQPPGAPVLSATEALIRQSEKMRVLGPVLGRMQTEFLAPLVNRVFNILLRSGELPPLPGGVARRDLVIDYASPVARAQKQYEAQTLTQAMTYLAPLMQGGDSLGLMDNFDTDRIARHAVELFGAPEDYLLPERDVRAARVRALGPAQEDGGEEPSSVVP